MSWLTSAILVFVGVVGGIFARALWGRLHSGGATPADATYELIPQLIWFAKPTGDIEFFNRQWQTYTGIDIRHHLGRGWREVIHADDVPGLHAERDRAARVGRNFEFRARLRDSGGRYRWFFIQATPQKNERGEIIRWVGACTDIHALIAAESELKLNRDRLQMALSAGQMAAWEADLQTGEIARSENHDQLYGYDQRQGRWTFHDFLSAVHEDDQDRLYRSLSKHQALAASRRAPGDESFSAEFRVRWPDGRVRWLASRAQFQCLPNGEVVSLRGVLVDITGRKEAEASIAAAKETAEEASRAKSQFLANVSHELRTPLGAILGFQRMLRDPHLSKEERRQYLEIIERNGTTLMQLIDDLLDHSRLEAKSLSIERLPLNLNELIDDVMHVGGLKAEEKAVLLRVSRAPELPERIVSDSTRVRQILTNLIVNAIKFTERGEVRVEVSVAGTSGGQEVVFDIRDTGIGIGVEARETLFAPFRQGDATTTRRFGGTGLGLALSRDLARAMSGDVELVASEPGTGSWFRFRMPLEVASPIKAPNTRGMSVVQERLDGLRVLIVDDSPDNQLLMKRMLDRAGASVRIAANGLEAIHAAEEAEYDVILMDMQMPVLDGLTATKRLRASGYRRPIIALTAHALREEREKCLAAGCDEHVSKPVDFRRLKELLRRAHPEAVSAAAGDGQSRAGLRVESQS